MATAVPCFVMAENSNMWDYTLNMVLAAYLSKKPDRQIKIMANRYRKQTGNLSHKRTLRKIEKSRNPSLLVLLVYENLIS